MPGLCFLNFFYFLCWTTYFFLHPIHFWDDWFQTKKREQIGIPNKFHLKIFRFNTWWSPGRYWLFRFFTVYQIKKKREKCCSVNSPSKLYITSTLKTDKKAAQQSRQGRYKMGCFFGRQALWSSDPQNLQRLQRSKIY